MYYERPFSTENHEKSRDDVILESETNFFRILLKFPNYPRILNFTHSVQKFVVITFDMV